MDIAIFEDSDQVAAAGAEIIRQNLQSKPESVFGLATGNTPRALYSQLVDDYRQSKVSFAATTTFNLDEYLGLLPEDPRSYRSYMQRELFDHIDIDVRNTFLPACGVGEDPRNVGPEYDQLICSKGGIDLQILGIGQNGHIGFNEPTSSLVSRTRIKTLTRETIASNRQYFDDGTSQAQLAITMGIATIMDAREILLLATGSAKAEAVGQSLEGPVTAMRPASILQMHERVTVLLDEAAASALKERDYYNWVQEQKRDLLSQMEGP